MEGAADKRSLGSLGKELWKASEDALTAPGHSSPSFGDRVLPEKLFALRRELVLLCLLALAIVLFLLLLQTQSAVAWDTSLFLTVNSWWNPSYELACRIFSELGSFYFWFAAIFVLWIAGKREAATYLLVAILIHIAVGGSLKYLIDRPRPFEILQDINSLYLPEDPSFPSGHTEGSFAAAAVLGMKYKRFLIPLAAFAAFVGFGRVYYGVHFPLDVIGGAVFGILIGLLAFSFDLSKLQARMERGWDKMIAGIRRTPGTEQKGRK